MKKVTILVTQQSGPRLRTRQFQSPAFLSLGWTQKVWTAAQSNCQKNIYRHCHQWVFKRLQCDNMGHKWSHTAQHQHVIGHWAGLYSALMSYKILSNVNINKKIDSWQIQAQVKADKKLWNLSTIWELSSPFYTGKNLQLLT